MSNTLARIKKLEQENTRMHKTMKRLLEYLLGSAHVLSCPTELADTYAEYLEDDDKS